ncbi:DUF6002 family protein [Streptomyces smyrnaeus]|uniref:DUF6002 family protein n=1 Tax=Streptomyces smyrnaeus TaxID=1387713 RepID=UPI0033B51F6C
MESPLIQYYSKLQEIGGVLQSYAAALSFRPSFELPPLENRHRTFLETPEMCLRALGHESGCDLRMLDLTGNPRTRTTKTFASLLMVLRAVHHIETTGERIVVVTPSSGNKATALRDAVLRAYESGLTDPERLRLLSVVPSSSAGKVWASPLDVDETLRAANPVVFFDCAAPAEVKNVAQSSIEHVLSAPHALPPGYRIWFSLDPDNYRHADAARAFAEQELWPRRGRTGRRLQAHTVSSAYGLLGHALGERWTGRADSSYFLIQHMATPDLVLHWAADGNFSTENLPDYQRDGDTGLLTQNSSPHFPHMVHAVDEEIDPTFYTRTPITAEQMTAVIRKQGGGGIVVSRAECEQRYEEVRKLLLEGGYPGLPQNSADLREWSLPMGLTGVLNALDRGLVQEPEILLHGTGVYSTADFEALPPEHAHVTDDAATVAQLLLETLHR